MGIEVLALARERRPVRGSVLPARPEAERLSTFYRCWTCKEAYLKARAYNANVVQTRQQADLILDGYREAVRLDPKFALAWAQLARESFRTGWVGDKQITLVRS